MDKDRIYGHAELALLYFKNIQPKSASTQLARWIRRDEELWEELLLAGYRKGQKVFTPATSNHPRRPSGRPGDLDY